uniref:BPTI/Kunitz inhibitor domain-containing protein n=1 Tax=Cyprinus carpio TaxID=7962 RepID=A0A8C1RGD9_CYPCA
TEPRDEGEGKDEGACFAILHKYYYDNEAKICRTFLYGGCRGNGNRFDSREDCHKVCLGQFKSHLVKIKVLN